MIPAPQYAVDVPLLTADQWKRLHPLSPVVRVGAALAGMAVLAVGTLGAPRSASGARPGLSVIFWAVAAGLTLLSGLIAWLVTRWRIHGGDLQIETGLIRRQSFRVPLARIQAVDVVAPLTARILGLAEVRVISAGRGLEKGRLAYVSAAEAPILRAQLLALAHGLAPHTPEPPAYQLLRVDNTQLALGLLLRAPVLIPFALLVGVLTIGVAASGNLVDALGAGSGIAVVLFATSVRVFNDDYNFAISEAGDGLRLDRGLLQQRHETIPYGRIQGVRWVEPLFWRPFGWCRLEVDVARQHVSQRADHDGRQVARTLIPIASRQQAAWLLWRIMPGATVTPPPGAQPPVRAMWKAPFSYHFLAAWSDTQYACARTGRFRSSVVIVPLDKVQSVRLACGPLQRMFRLATVHIDTAGRRWQASARCRDSSDADRMLWQTAELSQHARRARPAPGGIPAA